MNKYNIGDTVKIGEVGKRMIVCNILGIETYNNTTYYKVEFENEIKIINEKCFCRK